MCDDQYAMEKLIWVEKRLAVLKKVDEKLQEMKIIAEYARDNELSKGQKKDLNVKINILDNEVKVLYQQGIVSH